MTDFETALEACREVGIDVWPLDGHVRFNPSDAHRFELLGRMVGWLIDNGNEPLLDVCKDPPHDNGKPYYIIIGCTEGDRSHEGTTPLSACAAAVRAVGKGE